MNEKCKNCGCCPTCGRSYWDPMKFIPWTPYRYPYEYVPTYPYEPIWIGKPNEWVNPQTDWINPQITYTTTSINITS